MSLAVLVLYTRVERALMMCAMSAITTATGLRTLAYYAVHCITEILPDSALATCTYSVHV
jgi:hypothetical protein